MKYRHMSALAPPTSPVAQRIQSIPWDCLVSKSSSIDHTATNGSRPEIYPAIPPFAPL